MSKKLIYLTSFVLVTSLIKTGAAEGADPSLVAWYRFDGNALDSSGNDLHGTEMGNPTYEAGVFGQAISLDGNGDYVDCGLAPEFDITDYITFTYWIKVVEFDKSWNTVLSRGDNSWRSSRAGMNNFMEAAVGGTTGNYTYGVTPVDDGQWHHVGWVYDGRMNYLYADGEVDATEASTGQITVSSYPLWIGDNSQFPGRWWTGLIDDVQIYNRALSQEEVQRVMQASAGAYPQASSPVPVDGALHQDTWASLSWLPGDTAVSHDVYFGESFVDVDNGIGDTFRGNQTGTVFTVGVAGFPCPDGLVPGTTYYWRIDEVNDTEPNSPWKGDVWSFTVSSMSAEEDFETNNFSTFPWEHHGDASWTITSYEKHSGTYSAQAGAIDHDERTTLRVRLDCVSGDITFYRKVSSEGGCDYLKFYIDGEEKGEWSGTTDWDQVSFPVRAGTRTFEWTYSKDGSVSSHWDTAWIDDLVFSNGSDTIPTGEVIELTDATFDQIVLSSDVPVLVDFWAPWCGPCLVMAPVIEEIADEYAGRIKVCKLNVDNAPVTTTNYGIRFIPTFILFEDGQVQRQWVGVTSKNELTDAIDELL